MVMANDKAQQSLICLGVGMVDKVDSKSTASERHEGSTPSQGTTLKVKIGLWNSVAILF